MGRGIRGDRRMNEDNGCAPLQLLEKRGKSTVPEVNATRIREQHDAVELQYVQSIGELTQTSLDVRQRHARETPEARGMLLDQLRGEIIATSRQLASRLIVP